MPTPDPDRAEPFRWTMDAGTMVVRAIRPNGEVIESAKDKDGKGTHLRSAPELSEMHIHARNAADFIRRVDL